MSRLPQLRQERRAPPRYHRRPASGAAPAQAACPDLPDIRWLSPVRKPSSNRTATPTMIATSATLKIPVRNGPTPTFMKSTTLPRATRSTQFDAPPANTRQTPISRHPCQRRRTATPTITSKRRPVPVVNSVIRTASGQSAPSPRNPPVFSTYSRRTVSARYERADTPARAVVATCFVTRSQPIVETTATSSTSRALIR